MYFDLTQINVLHGWVGYFAIFRPFFLEVSMLKTAVAGLTVLFVTASSPAYAQDHPLPDLGKSMGG